jgi:hypothetical protein
MKASGLDLRFGQQSGGVLILGIRAVELNLHDFSHWIALPVICDKAATFGSRSAMAVRTSRRSAFNVKIKCRTFTSATHTYVVTVVNSIMTVTMDGYELFTGTVSLPPVAYLGFTASTGGDEEEVTISALTATVSAP